MAMRSQINCHVFVMEVMYRNVKCNIALAQITTDLLLTGTIMFPSNFSSYI